MAPLFAPWCDSPRPAPPGGDVASKAAAARVVRWSGPARGWAFATLLALGPGPLGIAQTEAVLDVGLPQVVFANVNRNDALAAHRMLFEGVAQRLGYKLHINTAIYDDERRFETALAEKALHLAVVDAWQFLECEKSGWLTPVLSPVVDGVLGRRFVILVRRDSGISSMADLQGRTMLRLAAVESHVCRAWLQTLLPNGRSRSVEDYFRNIETAAKPAAAVLPVFFGRKDACLIDERSFNLMQELNPQVGKVVEVLAQSELLVDLIVCFGERRWSVPGLQDSTIKALSNLAADPAGRQILALFKVSGLVPFRDEQIAAVRALRRTHELTYAAAPP